MSDTWYDPVNGTPITPGGELVGPSGRPRVYVGGEPTSNALLSPPQPGTEQPTNRLLGAEVADQEALEAARMLPDWDADPRTLFQRYVMGPSKPSSPKAEEPAAPARSTGDTGSTIGRMIDRLMGWNGEERYQTWPEKMVRSGVSLPGEVLSGAVPQWQRDPTTGEMRTSPQMIERAQDTAGLAMGGAVGGTGARAGEVALGSGPIKPARTSHLETMWEDYGLADKIKAASKGEEVKVGDVTVNGDKLSERDVADIHEAARELQKLAQAGLIDDRLGVWRGLVYPEGTDVGSIYQRNKVIDFPGLTAVARKRSMAEGYMDPQYIGAETGVPVMLNIQRKGGVIGHNRTVDDFHDSILPHGSRYRVSSSKLNPETGVHEVILYDKGDLNSIPTNGKVILRADDTAGAGLSAVANSGRGPIWHSAVENALEQSTTGSASGAQWLGTLRNARGVRPDEMEWLGLNDFLAQAQVEGRKVTRQELQDYVRSHQVELQDVQKGESIKPQWETLSSEEKGALRELYESTEMRIGQRATNARVQAWYKDLPAEELVHMDIGAGSFPRYSEYQLPGGENYREHLITLPEKRGSGNYTSSHWDEPNILAHVRTNDRVIDGKRSLHLEEVQSDWHQQGREKGYKNLKLEQELADIRDKLDDETVLRDRSLVSQLRVRRDEIKSQLGSGAIPDAPFKKTWPELALKRMIRRAAEEGYDRVSWTPGDAQAARYDLSKQIESINAWKNADGTFRVDAYSKGRVGSPTKLGENIPASQLADYVGKDLAEKISSIKNTGGPANVFKGLDLKIGGEGMREFYDKMLPKMVEKIGREHGVKVQRGELPVGKNRTEPVFYFDIPQSMRDTALRKGFPLFSGGKMFVPHHEDKENKK